MGGKSKTILRYAKKCEECIHNCKQPYFVEVIKCPFFKKEEANNEKKDNRNNS